MAVSNVVIWSWFNDFGNWQPYAPHVSNYIESNKTLGSVLLSNCEPTLEKYSVNYARMTQTQNDSGWVRPLQRALFPSTATLARGVSWHFMGDHGQWITYDMDNQQTLEQAYSAQQRLVDLSTSTQNPIPYIVDLTSMTQTRQRTGFQRRVQRLSGQTPYAADTQPVVAQVVNGGATGGAAGYTAPQQPAPSSASVRPATQNARSGRTRSVAKRAEKGEIKLEVAGAGVEADDWLLQICSLVATASAEDCSICLDTMSVGEQLYKLNKCPHEFHAQCLQDYYNSGPKTGSLTCPECRALYGHKVGDCPPGGMRWCPLPNSLAGHEACNAIQVQYHINAGTQGPQQPAPGTPYTCIGFPRTGYLPNNDEGREILELLKMAWRRRLTFTIGRSVTSGVDNTVVWNEIHHKTSLDGGHAHGYPDPNYLDNVRGELKAQGVTVDDLDL